MLVLTLVLRIGEFQRAKRANILERWLMGEQGMGESMWEVKIENSCAAVLPGYRCHEYTAYIFSPFFCLLPPSSAPPHPHDW